MTELENFANWLGENTKVNLKHLMLDYIIGNPEATSMPYPKCKARLNEEPKPYKRKLKGQPKATPLEMWQKPEGTPSEETQIN